MRTYHVYTKENTHHPTAKCELYNNHKSNKTAKINSY